MVRAWNLYLRLVGAQVRSEMQYRASFLAQSTGQFLITLLDLLAIVILMSRFQQLGGWTLAEVAFLYGTSSVSFGLADLLAGNFDDFDRMVIRGEFDQVLLRPLRTEVQMMASGFHLRRLGRLTQGIVALAFAFTLLQPAWGLAQWAFLAVILAGGTVFFLAILIAGAAIAFWTPQTGEVVNVFTYGGQFMTSYPMHIYQEWLKVFFTFILPMSFINYYPALYLLNKPDPFGLPRWMPFLAPGIALLALSAALALWQTGIRHYRSTGS
jgi:ABC-2 type transport system permease protein